MHQQGRNRKKKSEAIVPAFIKFKCRDYSGQTTCPFTEIETLENATSVIAPVQLPFGHSPGVGKGVVSVKFTLPFLPDLNSSVEETVSVFICPGATLPPAFVQVVVMVAVALNEITTSWLLPSPAMEPLAVRVEPLSVIVGPDTK